MVTKKEMIIDSINTMIQDLSISINLIIEEGIKEGNSAIMVKTVIENITITTKIIINANSRIQEEWVRNNTSKNQNSTDIKNYK